MLQNNSTEIYLALSFESADVVTVKVNVEQQFRRRPCNYEASRSFVPS